MWKIRIEYDDHSKLTLTGKHKDIPYRLSKHKAMDLIEKIDELEEAECNE